MLRFSFGDGRLNARGVSIVDRIVSSGSLVVTKVGGHRAGEMGMHRFLENERVELDAILAGFSKRTVKQCVGRRILAVQDTTEINFSGRDRSRKKLGPAGDGKSLGFFIHPVLAIDADDEAVVGIVGAEIWTRTDGDKTERRKRPLQEKESQRWLNGAKIAAECLTEADKVIVAGDRESDIYSVFAQKPENVDLIVRAAHNRKTANGQYVFEESLPVLGEISTTVRAKPGQKERTARLRVSAGTVTLKRPRNGVEGDLPKTVTINVVETKEIDPPKGVVPLHWRLYTTLPVNDIDEAADVVRLYKLRWRIEEVFRVLKSDGLQLEDTQIEERDRLFKLSALALGSAARIIQLTDARDGSPRDATDIIDVALIEPVAKLGQRLEGKTQKQKNPHPKGNLAWLSWIVARLGGWNCYYRPPGPKTMSYGWNKLSAMLEGYQLALQTVDM